MPPEKTISIDTGTQPGFSVPFMNRHTRRALLSVGRRMERAVEGVKRTHTRAAAQPYIRRYSSLFRRYKDILGQL